MRFFIFRRKNFADKNNIGLFLNNTVGKEEKQNYRFNFKFYKLKVYILLRQALNLFSREETSSEFEARSFPPLITLLPWARPKDLRPLESQFIHTFQFFGETIYDIYKK